MVKEFQLGESILVRSPNWLGDAVMTMPAVSQLLGGGKRSVSVLAPAKLHEIWKRIEGVHEVLPVDQSVFTTAKLIRSKKFHSAVIFPNSLRTGLEVFLGGIPQRIGFCGHSRSWLLTKAVKRPIPPEGIRHQSLDYLDLVLEAGVEILSDMIKLSVVLPQKPDTQREYAVFCPGAEYGPAKRWPAERFAQVADQIAKKYGLKTILLGAPVDSQAAGEVASRMSTTPENLTGKTSLAEFIQYLAHAKIAVCNDSGSMHLAALLQTPAVAVFGSTEPKLTGPLGGSVRVVREHVPCSPCFLRECPIDFRCMTSVEVERIMVEVEKALKS